MDPQYVESRISRHLHYKAAAAGIPLSGTFELTPCCNLSCKMCYVRKPMQEVEAEGGLMPAGEWIAIAEKARGMGMLYLLLTGGEPLTHPGFREIYTACRNMGLVVSINTNGTLLDDDMLDFLAANPPAKVNMSLYGASRETYAGLCGMPEAYDRAIYALKGMKARNLTVKLNYSVTRYNCGDMAKLTEFARENGVNIQTATYMFPPLRRDGTQVGRNDRMSPEEDAAAHIRSERLRMSDEEFCTLAQARLSRAEGTLENSECLDTPDEHIRCRAGTTAFWINWSGEMTPCGMWPVSAADVKSDGFENAWRKTREFASRVMMPAKCTACPDRPVCMVCAASCRCETGSFTGVPEYLCRRTKAMLAETEKIYAELKSGKGEDK